MASSIDCGKRAGAEGGEEDGVEGEGIVEGEEPSLSPWTSVVEGVPDGVQIEEVGVETQVSRASSASLW